MFLEVTLLILPKVGGAGGKGNSVQSVFKWLFVPVCDTTLSASSREPLSFTTFDLTAGRKLCVYQLLAAPWATPLLFSADCFGPWLGSLSSVFSSRIGREPKYHMNLQEATLGLVSGVQPTPVPCVHLAAERSQI